LLELLFFFVDFHVLLVGFVALENGSEISHNTISFSG